MQFRSGDIIKRPGPLCTDHFGLFAGVNALGQQVVIHNAKDDCVRWDLLETFAAGNPVFLVDRPGSVWEGSAIIGRAQRFLGRKFDLVHFNCEHFVNSALRGKAESPQLRGSARYRDRSRDWSSHQLFGASLSRARISANNG